MPHPLIRGGNLQTIFGRLFSTKFRLPPEEILKVPVHGGDHMTVFLNLPMRSHAKTPVVVLLHELGGTAHSAPIARIAHKLGQAGFRTARVNLRGSRGGRATKLYHYGSTEDLQSAMERVMERWPHAPVLLAGLGVSGTILLNFLGSDPHLNQSYPNLQQSLVVCPTIDIEESRRKLGRFSRRYLGQLFLKKIFARLQKFKGAYQEKPYELSPAGYDRLIVDLEPRFKNLEDYYQKCSPKEVVSRINIPTMLLATEDDPVNPIRTILKAPYSEAVTLKIEKSGGHLGFLAGEKTRFGDRHWLDDIFVGWAEKAGQEEQALEPFPLPVMPDSKIG